MSNNVLIFYGTTYGHTAKVARVIADCLTNSGIAAQLVNGDSPPPELALREFDGVIIGASVIAGKHQRCVRRFVLEHHDALNAMPTAFFSVSGSAASRDRRGKIEAERCIDELLRETGWRPTLIESVAGAMAFTKYNFVLRWIMKQVAKRSGGPTDTSCDHELTDWTRVDRFAESFVDVLHGVKLPQSAV